MTPPLWRAIGVLELGAAVGLLVGLALGPLGIVAAVGIALLMLGAIVLHLRVRIAGATLVSPATVLVFAAVAAALRVSTL